MGRPSGAKRKLGRPSLGKEKKVSGVLIIGKKMLRERRLVAAGRKDVKILQKTADESNDAKLLQKTAVGLRRSPSLDGRAVQEMAQTDRRERRTQIKVKASPAASRKPKPKGRRRTTIDKIGKARVPSPKQSPKKKPVTPKSAVTPKRKARKPKLTASAAKKLNPGRRRHPAGTHGSVVKIRKHSVSLLKVQMNSFLSALIKPIKINIEHNDVIEDLVAEQQSRLEQVSPSDERPPSPDSMRTTEDVEVEPMQAGAGSDDVHIHMETTGDDESTEDEDEEEPMETTTEDVIKVSGSSTPNPFQATGDAIRKALLNVFAKPGTSAEG